jgi:hypothetical protein
MSDPWAKQQDESRIYFAQSEIVRTEKTGSNGNIYYEMKVFLTPVDPALQVIERTYTNFNAAWQNITIPSALALVNSGKLKSPKDLEQSQYVSYRWTEHKSYQQRDITYWKNRDADKLSVDDKGRTYKPFVGLEYLDVFSSQEEWQRAAKEANGDTVSNGTVAKSDPIQEAALSALPSIVAYCNTDMTKLQKSLSPPPFDVFNINSPEVRKEIAKLVIMQCGPIAEKQEAMLAEINSHFSQETPYLTAESPEMIANSEEVAF